MRCLLRLALVLLVAAAAAQEPGELADAVDAAVRAEMDRQKLVGVGAGVVLSDGTRYVQGYGNASLEQGTPVLPARTLFRWASMGKTLTAILAVDLVLAGRLDLDADVRAYYPDFPAPTQYYVCSTGGQACAPSQLVATPLPANSRTITMRMLLTHRAGIQHYGNARIDPTPPADLRNSPVTNTGVEWALPFWVDEPLIAVPGAVYSYSTPALNLAGVVLEHIYNDTYANLMSNRMATPLRLASLRPDYEWLGTPDRAEGYNIQGTNVGSSDVSWKVPGGGQISTPEDLTSYCAALMGDSFLSPSAKQLLWTPNSDNIGLAFFVDKDAGGQPVAVNHSGSQEKTATIFRYYLNEGFCTTVMSNSEHANTGQVENAISAAVRSVLAKRARRPQKMQ